MSSVHSSCSSDDEGCNELIRMPHDIIAEDEGVLSGERQSPIDLVHTESLLVEPNEDSFVKNYTPAEAHINLARDHVEWSGDAGGIVINGTEYKLVQCHWHSPSEHTLNGTSYDLELHLVHTSEAGNNAVVGILYEFGDADSFFDQLLPFIISSDDNVEGTEIGVIDPFDVDFDSTKYFRYNGSLTTPPFTENVIWTVIKKVKTISREQFRAIQDAGSAGDARPVQPLNGRKIYLHKSRACC